MWINFPFEVLYRSSILLHWQTKLPFAGTVCIFSEFNAGKRFNLWFCLVNIVWLTCSFRLWLQTLFWPIRVFLFWVMIISITNWINALWAPQKNDKYSFWGFFKFLILCNFPTDSLEWMDIVLFTLVPEI